MIKCKYCNKELSCIAEAMIHICPNSKYKKHWKLSRNYYGTKESKALRDFRL